MVKDYADKGRWHRQGMVAGALVMLLIGVACAGGGGSGGRVVSPSAGAGGGLIACETLAKFERYRYTLTMRLFSPQPETPVDETKVGEPPFALAPNAQTFEFPTLYEVSVVSPDRTHLVAKNEGQPDLELIYIGDQAWSKLESGWSSAGGGVGSPPLPPGQVCQAVLSAPDFAGVVPVEEELDGVATRRYRFDRVESNVAGTLLGPASDMGRLLEIYEVEVWLAEDGWPARLEISSEGTYPSGRTLLMELTLEVRDVNDKGINVEPPI